MEEMGLFYDSCLMQLYPVGSCGFVCNEHTFECYVRSLYLRAACLECTRCLILPCYEQIADVQQSCCDERGANCPEGSMVPLTCPVGCAIVFPVRSKLPRIFGMLCHLSFEIMSRPIGPGVHGNVR